MSEKWKLIPESYQPDAEDTRKENPHIKYVKMYNEDYVRELVRQVKDLSACLHGAINDSKNRGTQRACIPMIRKGLKTAEDFEK